MENSRSRGDHQYQSVSVFNAAADYFLGSLIEKAENDELHISESFFWVHAYQLDHKPDTYSPHMNIKNDKAIRRLIADMEAAGCIKDIELMDQPYLPDNVKDAVPVKIIGALGCRVVDLSRLKDMRWTMQAARDSDADSKHYTPSYDADQAILHLAGAQVRLQPNTNQSDLCRVLFASEDAMRKDWSFDEVLAEWNGREESEDDPRKVYRAARELNIKVAGETGIKNLFVYTTKTVKINPQLVT